MNKADTYLELTKKYREIGLSASQDGKSAVAHKAFKLSDKYLKLADKEINGTQEDKQ